jgi:hypothetical protein
MTLYTSSGSLNRIQLVLRQLKKAISMEIAFYTGLKTQLVNWFKQRLCTRFYELQKLDSYMSITIDIIFIGY